MVLMRYQLFCELVLYNIILITLSSQFQLVQNNATVRSLINIHEEEPKLSAIRLREEISQVLGDALSLSNSSIKKIVFKSKPSTFLKRLVAEKLVIRNANMDSVTIKKLNGKTFDPKNILMYSKDQKLSGKITVNKIVADSIAVGSLNDIRVEGTCYISEQFCLFIAQN